MRGMFLVGRGLLGVLAVLLLGPVGGAHGDHGDEPPNHQQTTCTEVLAGDQGWELKQETDPEPDSEVRAGDNIDVRMTWDATDFADGPLYNVLDCVTVDSALDTALSLIDRDAPNDGEFTYRITVPGGLSAGTELCSRGAIAGDGNGYFELNPSNDACFTVAEGGTPPEPPGPPDECAPGDDDESPPPPDDCAPPEECAPGDDSPPPPGEACDPPDECAPGGDDESPPPSDDCTPPDECAPGEDGSPPPPSDDCAPPSEECAPGDDDCTPPTPPEVCAPGDDGATPPEGCTPPPETPRTPPEETPRPPSNEPPTSTVDPPSSDVQGTTGEQPGTPEVLGPEVGSVAGDDLPRTGRPERAILVSAGVLLALGGAALIGAVKRPKISRSAFTRQITPG
ncbi:MAG: hypothetical protein ACRDZ3_14645 [Acidimicrobiia bacterium]